ncbi:DUF3515 family protein [Natronoglycomyces albus]|uniref:DUF3515 family protein n=1 Tax=Natronoglycomyces albus TaxID=2811108 RepID=A0A895XS71_9ACTN|nr:DUF3515 family protein [Natronoglycomyces albus]QSB06179.1 DUF3515 family protein [Natronoglycomyces albus]
MSTSSSLRAPFWIATIVAIPVMLLAGYGVYQGISSSTSVSDVDAEADLSPVQVDVPVVEDDHVEVICRALLAKSPSELTDLPSRPVEASNDVSAASAAELSAAWGDPAIVMTCGVDEVEVADTDLVYRWGQVCWFVDEGSEAHVWTSVDREVPVRVEVPAVYEQSGEKVSVLSPVVADAVPAADEAPTGCGS